MPSPIPLLREDRAFWSVLCTSASEELLPLSVCSGFAVSENRYPVIFSGQSAQGMPRAPFPNPQAGTMPGPTLYWENPPRKPLKRIVSTIFFVRHDCFLLLRGASSPLASPNFWLLRCINRLT